VTNRSVSAQPYGSSYFLPGKLAGKTVTFLLDTGCTTNLLSQRLFDTLSARNRASLEPYNGEPGTLADGSYIPFYGVVELIGRVRDQVISETIIFSQLKEDAILGMPFLKRHRCHIEFNKSAVMMAGRELACLDRFGRPLVGGVQVVQSCTVPGRSRATVRCRVNCSEISESGVVEGALGAVQLANSLNRLDEREEVLVQCVNPFTVPVELPAGSLVGKFHSVQEEDVGPALETADDARRTSTRDGREPVPEHVAELYGDACESKRERLAVAQLLSEYKDVFSCGEHDMRLTKAVCHEIPQAAGTVPIRQPTRRLGPEKEREVSQQVQDFLSQDLIEPSHGAWSSLVALVRKKDGSWRFCVDYRRLNSVTIQDAYPFLGSMSR